MHPEPVIQTSFQHYGEDQDPDMAAAQGSPSKRSHNMRARLGLTVHTRLAYIPLLICCFISGMMDSTLYSAYGTFVSMQTGNTIFFALGASGQNDKPYGWVNPLCSMGCFTIGSFAYANLSAFLGTRRRGTLVLSFFIQTVCIVLAAATIEGGIVNGGEPPFREADGNDWKELIPVSLLSFQAAGQIVNSRTLGVPEIPTVVITSLLCDLMSDTKLWAPIRENAKRNRRIGAFVLTLAGGICGGWIFKAADTIEPALWAIAGIKLILTMTWLFWTPENKLGLEMC